MLKSLLKQRQQSNKGEQLLMELNKTITLISKKFEGCKREKVERERLMKEMLKEIKNMSATIQSFKVSLDRKGQYS